MRLALSVVCALAMSANASARYFDTHERWTKRAAGEWWWVVEFRGRPLVYGANLRVVYKVESKVGQ